jgi:Holliday junction resolvasome RuvABC endonuclease subunit
MRFRPSQVHYAVPDRPPEVSILACQVVLSEHVIEDPTTAGVAIARAAVLLAQTHDAAAVAIEIPKGAIRREVTTSWGAQRETIGAVRALLRAYQFADLPVAPNTAKVALAGTAKADKRGMIDAVKAVHGWERLWDTAQVRLEAKADAVGICMAGAALWRRRLQEAA